MKLLLSTLLARLIVSVWTFIMSHKKYVNSLLFIFMLIIEKFWLIRFEYLVLLFTILQFIIIEKWEIVLWLSVTNFVTWILQLDFGDYKGGADLGRGTRVHVSPLSFRCFLKICFVLTNICMLDPPLRLPKHIQVNFQVEFWILKFEYIRNSIQIEE